MSEYCIRGAGFRAIRRCLYTGLLTTIACLDLVHPLEPVWWLRHERCADAVRVGQESVLRHVRRLDGGEAVHAVSKLAVNTDDVGNVRKEKGQHQLVCD